MSTDTIIANVVLALRVGNSIAALPPMPGRIIGVNIVTGVIVAAHLMVIHIGKREHAAPI